MLHNNIKFTRFSNLGLTLCKTPLMKRIILFSLVGLTTFLANISAQDSQNDQELTTIAFGSCSRQSLPQLMWPFVLDQSPDLWIWTGDNIYGDSEDMGC